MAQSTVTYENSFSPDNVLNIFSSCAQIWSSKKSLIEKKNGETRRLFKIINTIAKPGSILLDAGCGHGKVTTYVAENLPDSRVVSADFSFKMLRNLASQRDFNSSCFLTDVTNSCFRSAIFDVVIAQQLIHHTPTPEKLLLEFQKITKREGYLVLLTVGDGYHTEAFPYNHDIDMLLDPLGRTTEVKLKYLLESCSFSVVQFFHDYFQFEFACFNDYFEFIQSIGALQKSFKYKEVPQSMREILMSRLMSQGKIKEDGRVVMNGHYITVIAKNENINSLRGE